MISRGGRFGRRLVALGLLLAACSGPGEEASTLPQRIAVGEMAGTLAFESLDGRASRVAADDEHDATVIWFWSAKCGCVQECETRIRSLLDDYAEKRMRFLAVDSSDGDTADEIEALLARMGSPYEVLRDRRGHEAIRLGIEASASVAVLDAEGRLRYRGAIDDDLSRPTVSYVRAALDALLAGRPVEIEEVESYGCLYPLPGG